MLAAHGENAPRPVQQRGRIAALRFDVHGLIAVDRIHDHRQVQPLRIGAREAGVAIDAPLHRRAHAVAIADVDVVAHADLVAVVDDRRARHRQQQAVHQLDAVDVVAEQRREPAADADVDAHARLLRVHPVHVVALAIGHHLQRQLVVIAQEDGPLAVLGNVRRLPHDLRDRIAILQRHRHEDARHQREVIRHVAFVAVAEVLAHVLGPLVRLGEEHAPGVARVHRRAHALQHRVRFGQVLVVGALAHAQIRNRIEPHAVDAHVHPEAHDVDHRVDDARVVVIQIGLMREEAMPVVLAARPDPRPSSSVSVSVKMMRVPANFLSSSLHT